MRKVKEGYLNYGMNIYRRRNFIWLSVAVSFLVLFSIWIYSYLNYCDEEQNQNLGTYNNPEVAFRETQKVLSILSTNLNVGMESVQYLEEYENSKHLIFKQQ